MLLQCVGFSLITYFLYGLDPKVDKFFIHVFVLTLSALCFANFFRYSSRIALFYFSHFLPFLAFLAFLLFFALLTFT
jgi:hypothetical protein